MARCKAEDALDKAVWRYAQALPGARPPVWCVEDEIGNGFMRGSPVSIGTAHITDRRTGDTFALYWPEGDLDVGSAPRRDPYPHIKPGLRRDGFTGASTDSSERWRAAYDAFSTQASASSEVPASSNTKPPATTPLKVWTDVAWTSEVTDPRFIFVEDASHCRRGLRPFRRWEVPSSQTPTRVLVRLRGGVDQEGPPRGDVTKSWFGAPGARSRSIWRRSWTRCWGSSLRPVWKST